MSKLKTKLRKSGEIRIGLRSNERIASRTRKKERDSGTKLGGRGKKSHQADFLHKSRQIMCFKGKSCCLTRTTLNRISIPSRMTPTSGCSTFRTLIASTSGRKRPRRKSWKWSFSRTKQLNSQKKMLRNLSFFKRRNRLRRRGRSYSKRGWKRKDNLAESRLWLFEGETALSKNKKERYWTLSGIIISTNNDSIYLQLNYRINRNNSQWRRSALKMLHSTSSYWPSWIIMFDLCW